jgi:hypothetical protein
VRDTRDRRDLARLGLMVWVYGLGAAPVLHVMEDHVGGHEPPTVARGWLDHEAAGHPSEHGHSHEHGKGHPHQHSWGSVEHLQAVGVIRPVVVALAVRWVPLREVSSRNPEWVSVATQRLTAMPQGP